jgi:hypothetical protein
MLFAVPELKRMLLLIKAHMGEYSQCKGKYIAFDAMKAYRESRIIDMIHI